LFYYFLGIFVFGLLYISYIYGAVPDVTNNQVQVITTSETFPRKISSNTLHIRWKWNKLTWCSGNSFYLKIQLSVVTIVFDDDMETYLPRQLIAEKD
jgi:cobalt-zinc-cadmium resistance protein CzcA